MKQKGFSIESLHIIGCLLLVLNSLLFIFPGMTISRPSDVPMTFSVVDKIWIFAFPIFAFLLVEEFHHTENFNKLAACILAFAIIFEIPFDLVQSRRPFEINLNNQFFTLFFGAVSLRILTGGWNPVFKFVGIAVLGVVCSVADCEYGLCGILLVVLFQLTRSLPLKCWLQLGGTLVLSWFCLRLSLRGWMSMIDPGYIPFLGGQFINAQYLCALALIPISFCSLNRKAQRKMFLFVVYGSLPIAFLVIYLIRYFTMGL